MSKFNHNNISTCKQP